MKMAHARYSRMVAMVTLLIACMYVHAQQGIWKSKVPPAGTMQGEFENNDPIGLASGAEIKADCSLNWVDPADHKLYCFASGTSLETFMDSPQAFIAQARKG